MCVWLCRARMIGWGLVPLIAPVAGLAALLHSPPIAGVQPPVASIVQHIGRPEVAQLPMAIPSAFLCFWECGAIFEFLDSPPVACVKQQHIGIPQVEQLPVLMPHRIRVMFVCVWLLWACRICLRNPLTASCTSCSRTWGFQRLNSSCSKCRRPLRCLTSRFES